MTPAQPSAAARASVVQMSVSAEAPAPRPPCWHRSPECGLVDRHSGKREAVVVRGPLREVQLLPAHNRRAAPDRPLEGAPLPPRCSPAERSPLLPGPSAQGRYFRVLWFASWLRCLPAVARCLAPSFAPDGSSSARFAQSRWFAL